MASITFDSTELVSNSYAPKYIKHESAPGRELTLLELAREGGAVLVAEKYGTKTILISGSLKASSQSALETAIDSFKELFSRKAKNLDVGWAGSTRRYVATCKKHNFNRNYFHLNFVPWTAEFIIPTGIGEDVSETTLINNQDFTAASYASSMTFAGSAEPKPRIRVKCGVTTTDAKGVSIENTDNGERIVATRAAGFGTGKYFEIDARLKTVKYDDEEIDFQGVFPTFEVGANAYKVEISEILNQEFAETAQQGNSFNAAIFRAQSFSVPYTDSTFQKISLYVGKTGTPPNELTIEIWEDSDGEPDSANKVTNATFTIAEAAITTDGWYSTESANAFTLDANTRYWIVASTTDGDVSNNYVLWGCYDSRATYKRGNASNSSDSGANWTDAPTWDYLFKLFYGGVNPTETFYFDVYYYKKFL